MLSMIFTVLQIVIGLFLIFIIMLQRGKGGGLVGALGGMGGASAFGPKADIHVLKLTIGLAIAWVVVACTGIYLNRSYRHGNLGSDAVPVMTTDKDATEETVTNPKLDDDLKVDGVDDKKKKVLPKQPAQDEVTEPKDKSGPGAKTPEKAEKEPAEKATPSKDEAAAPSKAADEKPPAEEKK
ncbi:MAG: preprotein translocase subunit SecG [Planctomycetaceae bacterium]|nr:preprotein translocase subunit SecG [Planctomycetaceae bacterium]